MNLAQLLVAGQFTLFAFFGAAWLALPRTSPAALAIVGVVGVVLALVLLSLAILEHQQRNRGLPNITPTPNQHADLVSSGLYSRIRHPIYTAVLTGAIGAALMHGHLIVFGLAFVLIIFFYAKSRYEESLLRRVYPEYDRYMERTGRFLPHL